MTTRGVGAALTVSVSQILLDLLLHWVVFVRNTCPFSTVVCDWLFSPCICSPLSQQQFSTAIQECNKPWYFSTPLLRSLHPDARLRVVPFALRIPRRHPPNFLPPPPPQHAGRLHPTRGRYPRSIMKFLTKLFSTKKKEKNNDVEKLKKANEDSKKLAVCALFRSTPHPYVVPISLNFTSHVLTGTHQGASG